jgi:hypothetical protein
MGSIMLDYATRVMKSCCHLSPIRFLEPYFGLQCPRKGPSLRNHMAARTHDIPSPRSCVMFCLYDRFHAARDWLARPFIQFSYGTPHYLQNPRDHLIRCLLNTSIPQRIPASRISCVSRRLPRLVHSNRAMHCLTEATYL